MDLELFSKSLRELGKRVNTLKDNITTEEATKTSFVMPFFQILGYDVFNPLEFIPEFTADVGIKKGEKVDYAIINDNQPSILIEAKSINEKLTKHDSQLFRYFGTTTAKFGILTNGREYKFFTDLDETNKMDSTPFLTIDIVKIKENQIPELAKFHKENYDVDNITSTASELKYLNNLKTFIGEQLDSPSESFVKYILSEIYDGVKTKQIIDKFTPIISKGFNQLISERINEKLSAALNTSVNVDNQKEAASLEIEESEIVTTPEELETYTAVKLILKDTVLPSRVFYRDNKSYFNILLDDNIRKWIARIFINDKNKKIKIEFNDDEKTKVEIELPLDIIDYSEKIIEITSKFM